MSLSLTLQMTATASTKRAVALTGGQRTAPQPYLAGVPCTPIAPRGVEFGIGPLEGLETYMPDGTDIRRGDRMVVDGREYSVTEADTWPWLTRYGSETFVHVVVEDQVR